MSRATGAARSENVEYDFRARDGKRYRTTDERAPDFFELLTGGLIEITSGSLAEGQGGVAVRVHHGLDKIACLVSRWRREVCGYSAQL